MSVLNGFAHHAQGIAHYQKQHLSAAVSCFEKAYKADPSNIDFIEAYASVTALLGNLGKARQLFGEAMKLAETSPSLSLLNNFAHLLQRCGEFETAMEQYRKILKLQPAFVQGWVNLGECSREKMQFKQAAEYYARAYTLDPKRHSLLGELSYCYRTLCMWDETKETEDKLLQITQQEIDAGRPSPLNAFAALFTQASPASLKQIAVSQSVALLDAQRAQNLKLPELPKRERQLGERIRLGYFSAALANHATAHLINGLFQHHDRNRFEVFVYAVNVTKPCDNFRKIKNTAEHFHELNSSWKKRMS